MLRSVVRILVIVLAGYAAVMLAVFVWPFAAREPSRDAVASAKSPDGRVIAKLIEVNAGATTSFQYLVTLSEEGTTTEPYEVASLYGSVRNSSAFGANLRWTSPQELTVEYLEAKSAELLRPKVTLPSGEVAVVLRPNVTDANAPAGGMLYNLGGRR